MSDKPRRFWQIHLSTALVLMLAAGMFSGANLTIRPRVHEFRFEPSFGSMRLYRGWPIDCWFAEYGRTLQRGDTSTTSLSFDTETEQFVSVPGAIKMIGDVTPIDKGWYDSETGSYILSENGTMMCDTPCSSEFFIWEGVAINFLVGTGLLLSLAASVEYLIRPRSKP